MSNRSAAAAAEMTEVQQSIFNAPVPGSAAAAAPSGLPTKPPAVAGQPLASAENRGQKRPHEEEDEEEEDSDVAMEEDSDDD